MIKKYSPLIFVGGWLLLTVSMTSWWLIYGLMVVRKMADGTQVFPGEIVRGQRMLHWEGGSLILLLILGGVGLFYYSLREFHRNRQVEEFFATLTHELKTPLASLRLQVESLQEDLVEPGHLNLVDRLARDAVRLELQLENSLFLASVRDANQLHLENLKLQKMVTALKQTWPEIVVGVPEQCVVLADTRALEGILKNLVQNARVHGQATLIRISAKDEKSQVRLSIEDNGHGFKGDTKKLGKLFARHTTASGSGIGLYLARQLTEKMKGRLEFETTDGGFKAHVILRGGR
jgi:signal transduction histidine kinase